MLSQSNISVVDTRREFKRVDVPVCFLVPTKTGLIKSIMDATSPVREFLHDHHLHDFDQQKQGTGSKVLIQTTLISGGEITETQTSLYRPETKAGDPRIWIYSLGNFAEKGDLLAILENNSQLVVVNCSKSNLLTLLDSTNSNFRQLFGGSVISRSESASELLEMMKGVAAKGFIRTLRAGDTGVGYTLETLLGIAANSSKAPDYKGIEIKSGRQKSQRSGRTTVFSQVPNWKISRLKSSKDILFARGRYHNEKQRWQLFHEFSALKPNSYGMKLSLDFNGSLLHQICFENDQEIKDVCWEFHVLKRRLAEKHRETFWVTADTKGKSGDLDEEFFYSNIKHTSNADISVFPTLIETGVVTLDYTIKETKTGAAKDQGYLFKIASKNLDLLFSKVEHYSLI